MDGVTKDNLIERIYWLIRLRWIAVVAVVLVVFFTKRNLNIPLTVPPLYSIALLLGIYNLLFLICLNRINNKTLANLPTYEIPRLESSGYPLIINRIANVQISLDLLTLSALIHFSGGIENPFIFYFIFHMIIASILLSRRASFLQATFAAFLFCSMVGSEYFGILGHYCLGGFIILSPHDNPLYIGGVSFVFISTLYMAVYMATSTSSRLRERERSLKEANELLMEKDRLKSEYVLRVTHDVKEHLGAIRSCLEPVIAGITGTLNPKQVDLIQRASQRTGKLLFFVKMLLELTRIKLSREITMDYFPIEDTIKNAISRVEARSERKSISLNYTIEPGVGKIRGAQIYIEETIVNLLANSVKYTPRDGKINVSVKDKGNSILVEVSDTGIGIPGEELPKVFNEFYRAANARKVERDGTGLGLSMAKQVVERHRGEIWIESEEGKGTRISFTLPKVS